MPPHVETAIRPDGVAVITFSNPPVNALSSVVQRLISQALKEVNDNSSVRAVVLHGANSPGFFSGGADVSEFHLIGQAGSPFQPDISWCYDGAEAARLPVIAAIDGVCFGGGLELILCCAARICTPRSSFTLPELNLGIIPGLGGTQRLPRLVGFEPAARLILTAQVLRADRAAQLGLVDKVTTGSLLEAAIDYAHVLLARPDPKRRVIELSDKIGDPEACARIVDTLRRTIVPKLSKRGALPQYDAALEACLYGARHGGYKGLKEEARIFMRMVTAPHSRGLIHTFFSTRQTSKITLPEQYSSTPPSIPKSIAVIGGGLMGAGIATACLFAGIPVVIKELNEQFAAGAQKRVAKNLGTKGADKLRLLTVTTEYSAIAHVDMVIEAVLENPKLKIEIFAALEATCKPSCILASNTSTINIDLIGTGAPKAHAQGRIIGAHFFSPAHKMPLLEVVRTESTSPKVIKDVFALAKRIKKTPVLVGNCAGFAVNRMYFPQGMIAAFLTLDLGLDPYRVDRACETFGLAMGPFRLVDLVGLEVGAAVGGVFAAAFAERATTGNPVIHSLLKAGRKGQKTRHGFYKYGERDFTGSPDPEALAPFMKQARDSLDQEYVARIRKTFGNVTDEDIVNMVLLPCVNEGYRILEEDVAQQTSDLDICSIMGMAFPAHYGGLMFWAQQAFGGSIGVRNVLQDLHRRSGGSFPLFQPSFALTRSAERNKPVGQLVRPDLATGSGDDIVVVSAFRTAVGRAGRGGFKDTLPDNLILPVLHRVLRETQVEMADVGDVITGTVLQRGDTGVAQLRVAGLLAGLPSSVPVKTVNRLCSSGLQAIADGAAAIVAGHHKIIIAGGVESMSVASMQNKEMKANPLVRKHKEAMGCYMSMGQTSENVAERFGISRERQDKMAVVSHARASQAKFAGRQQSEIVPVHTRVTVIDKQTKEVTGTKDIVVSADEGVRVGVTMDRLKMLPAVFKKGGSTTPGNSSQLSDGAALVMMMKRSEAETRGLEPLASLRSFAVMGVEPAVMGIGPAVAIPAALEKAGISADDVDLFEINEAFGSQADYCIEKLGLNRDIVNVMGGAIAIGHPLGMTGARLTVSIIHELRRRGGRFGVVSMCIGTGMGAAAVYEINLPRTPSKM